MWMDNHGTIQIKKVTLIILELFLNSCGTLGSFRIPMNDYYDKILRIDDTSDRSLIFSLPKLVQQKRPRSA